jgi:hypothetical protein
MFYSQVLVPLRLELLSFWLEFQTAVQIIQSIDSAPQVFKLLQLLPTRSPLDKSRLVLAEV